MKLVIQIPCFNEEASLPITLRDLPRSLPGISKVEWLIIDDGSTDRTVEVARQHKVDHIVRQPRNRGLARAFLAGLERAIAVGADIIVNTDADNQYRAADIPTLIQPILDRQADMVVGARPIADIAHFSPVKKLLQKFGSGVVRMVSRTSVPDAPSGFRAFSREAAMKVNVFNEYTYTLETLIQAGQKGVVVASVPIRVNGMLRQSRLIRSIPRYIWASFSTIVRIFMTYRPFKFFMILGSLISMAGLGIAGRFMFYFLTTGGSGHVQSLILATLLLGFGAYLVVTGLVTDLISVNRQLLEKCIWRLYQIEDQIAIQGGKSSSAKKNERMAG